MYNAPGRPLENEGVSTSGLQEEAPERRGARTQGGSDTHGRSKAKAIQRAQLAPPKRALRNRAKTLYYFPGNGDGTFGSPTTLLTTHDLLSVGAPPATVGYGAPTAVAALDKTVVGPGEIITFDGSGSTDDAGIVSWAWTFGDSATGSGDYCDHAYSAAGTHTVTLTVTDAAGQTDTATTTATIDPGPKVVCVPWQFSGGLEVPHTTWSGKSIRLKGVVRGGTGTLTYTWNFGDGSPVATGAVSNKRAIEYSHTYTGTVGQKYNATLTVVDSAGRSDTDTYRVEIHADQLDSRVNVAIDEGLWWLHKNQQSSGYWYYSSYYASPTASAVQAFFINGHLEVGDPDEDPYVETVRNGMRYMFGRLRAVSIGFQTYGDPDTNGNGIGIEVSESNPIYQGGMVMDAIIASATPARRVWTGGTNVYGRTYRDVLQDMCDMYSWGQYDDTGSVGGGWRYSWNSWPDNSAAQWAAIGMIPAQEPPWSCTVPDWVKTRNNVWLSYSFNGSYGFGYTGSGSGWALTASGMVQVVMSVPGYKTQTRWTGPEAYYLTNWTTFLNQNNYYAYYAFTKAMRLSQTELLAGTLDWYRASNGMAWEIVNYQTSSGNWSASGYVRPGAPMTTAWAVIMLTPSLFELPPVADAGDDIVWSYDLALGFDASGSYHLDPARTIVLYEWDFDGDGTYDYAGANPVTTHIYPDPAPPLDNGTPPTTYTAVLRVTDDQGLTDTDTRQVVAAEPPHAPFARITGPVKATAGIPVTLSGSDSFDIDPGDTITKWEWDFDGSDGRFWEPPEVAPDDIGEVVTHSYATPGPYVIGLRVWDNGVLNNGVKLSSEPDYFELEVEPNLPPVADADGPYTVEEGTPLLLDGSGSADPNGDPPTYAWDLDNDGEYDDSSEVSPPHTWMDDGVYTVRLRVTDTLLDDTDTTTVTVLDGVPTAAFTATPDPQSEGSAITFDGSGSTSPADPIVSYEWDFDGDDLPDALGPVVTHTFDDDGDYTVTLTVTDDDGSADSITHTVTVQDNAPTAAFTPPAGPLVEGSPVPFTSSSTSFPDDIVSWEWDFDGDGIYDASNTTGEDVTHTYMDHGTYSVTLRVTDDDGSTDTATHPVTILDLGPTAGFIWAPVPQDEGSEVQFTDQSSSAPDALASWHWDFGGVGTSDQQNPSFTFPDNGVYEVTLTVTDDDGSTSVATQEVTIEDLGPTAEFTWTPDPQEEGLPVEFTDQSTSSPDTIIEWAWDFYNDGTIDATGPNVTHSYSGPGTYTVVLKVKDEDGSIDTVSHQITITEGGEPIQQDVTHFCGIVGSRVAYDWRTRKYSGNVTITNTSQTRIGVPVHLVIDSVTPATVTVANADGTTAAGKPYFDLSGQFADGVMDPGDSATIRIYFNNPARVVFTFKCSVWGVMLP